jgi:hypothetical protein
VRRGIVRHDLHRGLAGPREVARHAVHEVTILSAKQIQLADADATIDPLPTDGSGSMPEPELDLLSNILKTFNDQWGNIAWSDGDRVRRLIAEPQKVAADRAYQNARRHSDKQNARIEHDEALRRVIVGLMKDDTDLFRLFSDDPGFKRWLADAVFDITYPAADAMTRPLWMSVSEIAEWVRDLCLSAEIARPGDAGNCDRRRARRAQSKFGNAEGSTQLRRFCGSIEIDMVWPGAKAG